MNQIKRLGYVALSVPDVERAARFYTEVIGLEQVARNGEAIYLRCNEYHHALGLFEGEPRALHHLGLEVHDQNALEESRKHLERQGVAIEPRAWEPVGVGDGFCVRDPNGHLIEIHTAMQTVSQRLQPREVRPVRFGHITFMTPQVEESVTFFSENLGFRISDRLEGRLAAWMRCNQEHHGMAFVKSPLNKVNHYAFDLADWNELKRFADHMYRHGLTAVYGPGRHGPGNNLFVYVPDPAGNIIELTCEVAQIWDEEMYQPLDWPNVPLSVDVWRALMPPHHFLEGEGYAFNDWRMGSKVIGRGWSVVEADDFKALDPNARITTPTEDLTELKVQIPEFSLSRKDPLDHAKFMVMSDRQFAAGEGFSVSVEMAVEVQGTDKNPHGADPDDPRLASAAIILLDDASGVLFNLEVTNHKVMALRERFDVSAPGNDAQSVAFADLHMTDLAIEPGSWHLYEIHYHPGEDHLLSPGPDRVEWYVDGQKVHEIQWTATLDPPSAPVTKPSRFRIGMGIFTLLDDLPDGRGGVIPGLDPNYEQTIWGQGVTARWRKIRHSAAYL